MPKDKAKAISDLSKQFYLSHTRDACENFLYSQLDDIYNSKINDIKHKIAEAEGEKLDNLIEEKQNIEREIKETRFRIYIDYSDKISYARTVKINNGYEIVTPKPNPKCKESIMSVRKSIAHELGHLILHLEDLVCTHDTRGTKLIKDPSKEKEANEFADEIIRLKSEYYKSICNEKTFH